MIVKTNIVIVAVILTLLVVTIIVITQRYRIIAAYGKLFRPEFYNPRLFPHMMEFEKNFSEIRREVQSTPRTIHQIHREQDVWTGGGNEWLLENKDIEGWIHGWQSNGDEPNEKWLNYPLLANGIEFKNNLKWCPTLHKILLKNKSRINMAGLSAFTPNGGLTDHQDGTGTPYNSLSFHLPLIVPDPQQCILTVNGKVRHHRQGESLVFESTHTHSAWNYSDRSRIILYIDFKLK